MNGPDSPLDAGVAHARIRRVNDIVHSGRRFRSKLFLIVGILCLAYFAIMGSVSTDRSGLVSTVMTLVPIIGVVVIADVWNRRRGLEGRQLVELEYRLAGAFAVLVCVAGVLATVLPHPLPAALAGILPAAVCAVGAWQVARR